MNPSDTDLRRDFTSREELAGYLAEQFPEAASIDAHLSPIPGGRSHGLAALEQAQPARYAATRNFLDGAVTKLSPYLRHGLLTLAEVRDWAVAKTPDTSRIEKFITELAWRDYWQRIWKQSGDAILSDREPYKTGFDARAYSPTLPEDIAQGTTGNVCMDSFSHQLRTTGYLHNHARMWMAAYVVHWRRIAWQAGARWFLSHLLDGDPASNHLSWQWVASTFSHKPYFFNRENLERYTHGVYCRRCPQRGHCDFEGSYEQLADRLFRISQENAG